jgi:hypothetical protein
MAAITKFIYSTVQFEPSFINFRPTTCDFSMLTVSNTGVTGDYTSVMAGVPMDLNDEMAIYSRTTELSDFSGNPSNRIKVQMFSSSDYLTPIVNLERTYSVYVHNLINSNTAYELSPSGGMLRDKYISQVVTLADGQDAEDLLVSLSAYRPPGSNSDIKVYIRFSHSEDFESIYRRNWIEMESVNPGVYSSMATRKDWREFNYRLPDSYMTGRNDQDLPIVGYTNSANVSFQGYKQYQVKIGLQSDSSAIYPRCADLRVIACQR